MKYLIWDRIQKLYDSYKYMDQDGHMLQEPNVHGHIIPFDRDDFEVQWVKQAGYDVVDISVHPLFKDFSGENDDEKV